VCASIKIYLIKIHLFKCPSPKHAARVQAVRKPAGIILAVLVVLTLLAATLYTVAHTYSTVDKTLNSLRLGTPSLKKLINPTYGPNEYSLTAVIPLTNPSREPIMLRNVNCSVLINGTPAGSLQLNNLELGAGSEAFLNTPLNTGADTALDHAINSSATLNLTVVVKASTDAAITNRLNLGSVSRTMVKQALINTSTLITGLRAAGTAPITTSSSGWVSIPEAGIRVSKDVAWVANGYRLDAVGDGVRAEAVIMVEGLGGNQGKPVSFCVAEDMRVVHDYYANCAEFDNGIRLGAGEVGFVVIPFKAEYSFGMRGYYVTIGKPADKGICGDSILSPSPRSVMGVNTAPHVKARILNPTKYTDCGLSKAYYTQKSSYPPRLKFVNKDSIASVKISWLVNGHEVTSVKKGTWVDADVLIKAARPFDDPDALVCVKADLKVVSDKDVACAHLHINLVAGEDYEVIINFKASNYGHSFLGIGKQRGFYIHLNVGGYSMTQESRYPPRLKYKG